jgi:hypothetical protein
MLTGGTVSVRWLDWSDERLLTGDSSRRIEERDRRAPANPLGKVKSIPIGKPNAAMRPGFADLASAGLSKTLPITMTRSFISKAYKPIETSPSHPVPTTLSA